MISDFNGKENKRQFKVKSTRPLTSKERKRGDARKAAELIKENAQLKKELDFL